jgi:glucose-6-phosphate isomerase
MLPLTLQYGWDTMSEFLEGANAMDDHFKTAPLKDNLPVLLGLISLWNISFLGYPARALLPYCQVRWLSLFHVMGIVSFLLAVQPTLQPQNLTVRQLRPPTRPHPSQALSKFAPHIQQVSMESNGKGVDMEGRPLPFEVSKRQRCHTCLLAAKGNCFAHCT